jgi:hypothetical protein
MPGIRTFDKEQRTMKLEFVNGQEFGPIENNPVTDVLTKMILELEGRVAALERKAP